MSAVAGRTTTGKVWHVCVWNLNQYDHATGGWVPLCGAGSGVSRIRNDLRDLSTVPAYRLCQKCERTVEQLAVAVREVQS